MREKLDLRNIIHEAKVLKSAMHDNFHAKDTSESLLTQETKLDNVKFLKNILKDQQIVYQAYDLLTDSKSKHLFHWAYKSMIISATIGYSVLEHYPLPDFVQQLADQLSMEAGSKKDMQTAPGYTYINGYKLKNCAENDASWIYEQYKLDKTCEVKKGDHVISAGAHFGDTSTWFADIVGEEGKVYAFEPSSSSFNILENTVKDNQLDHTIIPIKKALWNKQERLYICNQQMPAQQFVTKRCGHELVDAVTLDEYLLKCNEAKVDYIKFDVEGAELKALQGAQKTIRCRHPRLAISVYHKAEDMINIPIFLKQLVNEYNFYLSKKTAGFGDVILFASTDMQ